MMCEIREIVENDRGWLRAFLTKHWGSPQIPLIAENGIPIRDELRLEKTLLRV